MFLQLFDLLSLIAGTIGAVMAALSGAGVGTVLAPTFAFQVEFKTAVAAAAVPHLVAASLRAWRLRRSIDWRVVLRFGVACAVSGLVGALAQARVGSRAITYMFAALLILAGALGISGWADRVRLGRSGSWIAGVLSGFFGGLAGEQGGVRAVALLGFDLKKQAFVGTATAIAVIVDLVRTPVYLAAQWESLRPAWGFVAAATAGVVLGTWIGTALLGRLPERLFRPLVSAIILLIGVLLFLRPSPQRSSPSTLEIAPRGRSAPTTPTKKGGPGGIRVLGKEARVEGRPDARGG